ncbi:MAG: hypothetical protein ACXWLM_12535, partial [Myxococcales bacterium]
MVVIVLALNVGSSSLKYALFSEDEQRLASGTIERKRPDERIADRIETVFALLREKPDAVGHRMVHGGPRHARPERVTPALLASLREMVPFAPL